MSQVASIATARIDDVQGATTLRWFGILRLGLVQAALGAVVVLVTSTLNRVMVVEFAFPAMLPGALVALHYVVQLLRPRFGFQSDRGARQTPWIIGGMCVLAAGGTLCASAAVLMTRHAVLGIGVAVVAYAAVGLGVGAAGTSLLLLLSKRVATQRRAAAATCLWILMIAGFAMTSALVGHFLEPFSPRRLIVAAAVVGVVACLIAIGALWSLEGPGAATTNARTATANVAPTTGSPATGAPLALPPTFREVLRDVWCEPRARNFTLFVFVSMLAYSAQELLLEPFAGMVFGYSVGGSAQLSGLWHFAALIGMIGVGVAGSRGRRGRGDGARRDGGSDGGAGGDGRPDTLRHWTIGGCIGSAAGLLGLVAANLVGPSWPLRATVVVLGVANGTFAVAAIASMMELAQASAGSAGVRLGLWGAAQAIAFAAGGLLATAIVDSARVLLGSSRAAFGIVFLLEALLFVVAAGFVAVAATRTERELPEQLSTVRA